MIHWCELMGGGRKYGIFEWPRKLEIGSAFGRDAGYLERKGHSVECTDATQAFVDLLNKANFGDIDIVNSEGWLHVIADK